MAGADGATIGSNVLQGAAYVFVKPASGWASETAAAKLTASDGATQDALGDSVALSRDGSTVAAGAPAIFAVRYDAKAGRFVPYLHGLAAQNLSFSRDGAWIAYVASSDGTLWRSKLDGSERVQLTFPPMQTDEPRWSSDGKRIAFIGTPPGRPSKIYLIAAEGGRPEQLLPGEQNEASPDWSPDGNSIAFGSPIPQLTTALFGSLT